MANAYDLLLQGGTCVTPSGPLVVDIGVRNGRIAALGANLGPAEEVVDCRNLHVLPGLIDTQVHFR
ncbi:MAG: dihydroorotase, partial [Myxococcota bacterium]